MYTVGKLMPTYYITFVNSLQIADRVVLLLLISDTFLYNILLESDIIAFYFVDFILYFVVFNRWRATRWIHC